MATFEMSAYFENDLELKLDANPRMLKANMAWAALVREEERVRESKCSI